MVMISEKLKELIRNAKLSELVLMAFAKIYIQILDWRAGVSAPPDWVHIWSLNLVRVVCRLSNSSLDTSHVLHCLGPSKFVGCLVVRLEVAASGCLDPV